MEETRKTVLSDKSPPKKKSRFKGQNHGKKLRHGKKQNHSDKKPSGKIKSSILSQELHQKLSTQNEDENVGITSVNRSSQIAENGLVSAQKTGKKIGQFSKKIRSRRNDQNIKESSRIRTQNDKSHFKNEEPVISDSENQSNAVSRRLQKRKIQKSYITGKGGTGSTASGTAGKKSVKEKGKELLQQAGTFVKEHAGLFSITGVIVLVLCLLISQLSSCSSMATGSTGAIIGSSYTAEDADIKGADADYSALEAGLRNQINRVEREHPGYDEYQYHLAEINHNPYVLASYLTVLYEDYKRDEVQSTLRTLFGRQYKLTFRDEIQIRTRTETRTGQRTIKDEDGKTRTEEYEYEVEVEYEYKILHTTLENRTLERIIDTSGLDNVKQERYVLLNQTLGNRSYLFGNDIYSHPGTSVDAPSYDIPGEALTDVRFARMINEAEKYLGYPYVWGGSSPSTSFDCSGFVCWVINHSGNGWNYGRTTAEGLRQRLSIIPAGSAKPGDIIFFQGTYNTAGASHVGIYVGNGMMIHCGNPIQYASINSNYWQQHFYCFGRLP